MTVKTATQKINAILSEESPKRPLPIKEGTVFVGTDSVGRPARAARPIESAVQPKSAAPAKEDPSLSGMSPPAGMPYTCKHCSEPHDGSRPSGLKGISADCCVACTELRRQVKYREKVEANKVKKQEREAGLVIPVGKVEGLLDRLKKNAEDDFRTPEDQALFLLREMLMGKEPAQR